MAVAGQNLRRHERIPCVLAVTLAWSGGGGTNQYVRGKCRDISPEGLRVETTASIPPGSSVSLSLQKGNVAGSASVRYVRRSGSHYIIGLELSHKIRQELLEALRIVPSGTSS